MEQEEACKPLPLARYRVPGEGVLTMDVDEQEGQEDFVISVALCTEAIKELAAPVQQAIIVQPRRWYTDGHF